MYLSSINYQMGITQNYSLNNSINFKQAYTAPSVVEKRIVRNLRTYYPKDKQPLWRDLLEQFTKGFTRKEKRTYNAFGDARKSTETVFYDANGNIMAKVYDIKYTTDSKCNRYSILQTKDKDFCEWGSTGTIDCYDEDHLVEVTKTSRPKPWLSMWNLSQKK